ncbi:serine hydrolase [Caproiciproducens faecalis]|uniref:Serine hydrolase n=1 Tax=Caproiciproducens faecalis TaxID=2820301 RepID=A0ABS7DP40_9FIRM|nr:serine hydrolase [Caproiciproducens faecalis]MBW7573042.1 serine hydrolase [Caproiciproducens faecalis]
MKQQELRYYAETEIIDINANVSLLVYDLDQNETLLSFHAENQVVSASTIKTPILLTALDLVQSGKLKTDQRIPVPAKEILDDTEVFDRGIREYSLEELLTWMIVNSDNTATNVLIEFLGMNAMNAYCQRLGLKATVLERKMLDWEAIRQGRNNYTSAQDQLTVFQNLYRASILTPELCRYALGILGQQRDFSMALRYIADKDFSAAHKTGGLNYLNHDTGIFSLPGHNYYFGCFVTDSVDDTKENEPSKKLIGRLSRAVYDYYKEG